MAEADKRTPVFDWEVGDFKKDPQGRIITVTEEEAVAEIALKAVNTARGVFLIYANVDEPEEDHKYGSDVWDVLRAAVSDDIRLEEIKRAVTEALIYDPWVLDVTNVSVERPTAQNDAVTVDLTISTIFDREVTLEGVNVENG